MKASQISIVMGGVLLAASAAAWIAYERRPDPPWVISGRLVVKFTDGLSKARIDQITADHGTTTIGGYRPRNYLVLKLPPGKRVFDAQEEFAALPEVQFALPDMPVGSQ